MNAMTQLSLFLEKMTHETSPSQKGWPPSKTGGRESGRLLETLTGNRDAGWPDKALRPSLWTTRARPPLTGGFGPRRSQPPGAEHSAQLTASKLPPTPGTQRCQDPARPCGLATTGTVGEDDVPCSWHLPTQ